MVTPAAERRAVTHLMDAHGMSERRACKATGFCRMTMRYKAKRGDDASLRERMKAIARERRRFGYRRLHVLLRLEGFEVNHKRLFPALPRGTPDGPPPGRLQAGHRDTGADDDPDAPQRT